MGSDAPLADVTITLGARDTEPPVDAEFFTGRSAYLSDPEGNVAEVSRADPGNPMAARRARC